MTNESLNTITVKQLYRLIPLLILPTGALALPTMVGVKAGNGGWLCPWLSASVSLVVIYILGSLDRGFPNQTFIEYAIELVGAAIGRSLGVLYSLFFLFSGMMVVLETSGFIVSTVLKETPRLIVLVAIYGAMAYMLSLGLEGIARLGDILYMFLFVLIVTLVVGSTKDVHVNALFPLLDQGWSGVLSGSYIAVSWFCEVIVAAMFFPSVKYKSHLRTHLVMGVLVTSILLSAATAVTIGVLGPQETARNVYATFNVVRYIQWGEFFQHIDAFFIIPWISVMILKSMMFYHAGVMGLTQTCGISRYQLLIVPLMVLSVVSALWLFPNEFSISEYHRFVFPNYAVVLEVFIPALLWIVFLIKSRASRTNR